MKSGKCPKCGSADVYASKYQLPHSTAGNYIRIGLGESEINTIHLIHYACGQCNFIESYVADATSMQNILNGWKPLHPNKAKDDEG